MKFKFEELKIWNLAMDLGEELCILAYNFPEKEKFNLSSQLSRAANSIALNISEGSIGQTNPEFNRFMSYAFRSLAEFVPCLHKAKRREYIPDGDFDKCFYRMNMMNAFRKTLISK